MPVGTIQFARRRGKAAAFRNRTMNLPHGLNPDRWRTLLRLAREEDLGPHGDVTTALLPEPLRQAEGRWELRAREAGRFCGRELLAPLSAELAPEVRLEWIAPGDDGRAVQPGETLARLSGRVCQMLAAERVLLNFLQRLSGVATLTARYVERIAGTHAKVYDTRKTLPGWRDLDKYAVRCGGGHNHRRGLYDAVLIKDNHIAGVPTGRLAHTLMDMLTRLAAQGPPPAFVEVECDDLAQVAETFKVVGIDVVLLDNFSPEQVARAAAMRDDLGLRGKVELEASGGITLETITGYARAGADRLSVGALTHSAAAMDLALDAVA